MLAYDAENRVVGVTTCPDADGNGCDAAETQIAQFTYDGDGKRVKSVEGGAATLFVGGHYEVKGSEITKYYFAGATRVAMRKYTIPQSMTVEYILGDHLGSTSITTDSTGTKTSELRYTAWGEVRYTWGSTFTNYTYTGQYSYMDDPTTAGVTEGFGLMFYNARWYDPALGRFAQADSIIPLESQGVQAWDRYAYVNNNPVRYLDPSGRSIFDSYMQGWSNFSTAANVLISPNTSAYSKFYAGTYMVAWGGAHALLGVGVGMLACAASGPACVKAGEALLGIGGACKYGDCLDRAASAVKDAAPVIQDLVDDAFQIADDAFVAIHPSAADASIETFGLDPNFSTTGEPYTYVTQWQHIKDLTLEQAANSLKVPSEKWTTQPTTLWEVKGGSDSLFEYSGPGLGNIPQWASAQRITNIAKHLMR